MTDAPPSPAGRPAGPGVQQRHAILSSRKGLTYRSVVPTSIGNPAQASALQPTRSLGPGQPGPPSFPMGSVGEGVKPTLRQACSRPKSRAQFAFKDSMIHIICNSHYVSHFAAFFIDTGAKISVVESCLWFEGCSVGRSRQRSASDVFGRGSVWGLSQPEPRRVVGLGVGAVARSRQKSLVPRTAPPDLADRTEARSTGSRRALQRLRPRLPGRDDREASSGATTERRRGETGVRVERC